MTKDKEPDYWSSFTSYLSYGIGIILSSLCLYFVSRFIPEKFNQGVLGIILAGVICIVISIIYLLKFIKHEKKKVKHDKRR